MNWTFHCLKCSTISRLSNLHSECCPSELGTLIQIYFYTVTWGHGFNIHFQNKEGCEGTRPIISLRKEEENNIRNPKQPMCLYMGQSIFQQQDYQYILIFPAYKQTQVSLSQVPWGYLVIGKDVLLKVMFQTSGIEGRGVIVSFHRTVKFISL